MLRREEAWGKQKAGIGGYKAGDKSRALTQWAAKKESTRQKAENSV